MAFPEGTTTRGPGMRTLRPGLFRAAAEHGFAVTPVAIEYRDPRDAWVDDDTLLGHCLFWLAKPRTTVTLRFGPRLTQHPPSAERLRQQVEEWLGRALRDLNRFPEGAAVRPNRVVREIA